MVGERVARALPSPSAAVIVAAEGGNFCPIMAALGWPRPLTPAEQRDATLIATLEWGEANCDWKP